MCALLFLASRTSSSCCLPLFPVKIDSFSFCLLFYPSGDRCHRWFVVVCCFHCYCWYYSIVILSSFWHHHAACTSQCQYQTHDSSLTQSAYSIWWRPIKNMNMTKKSHDINSKLTISNENYNIKLYVHIIFMIFIYFQMMAHNSSCQLGGTAFLMCKVAGVDRVGVNWVCYWCWFSSLLLSLECVSLDLSHFSIRVKKAHADALYARSSRSSSNRTCVQYNPIAFLSLSLYFCFSLFRNKKAYTHSAFTWQIRFVTNRISHLLDQFQFSYLFIHSYLYM